MRRTWLLAAVAALILAGVLVYILRPEPVRRIAFLGMDARAQASRIAAFRDEMGRLGYVDGRNIRIEEVWADGAFERLPELAKQVVAGTPDVIVTAAPPAVRAAQKATSAIPIVMTLHDPVGLGLVASLAHPGGNITGVAFQDSQLSTKRLDLLRKVVPGLSRVAFLWHEAGSGNATLQEVQRAASAMGLESKVFELRGPADIAPAVAAAKEWGAQAMLQIASPLVTTNRKAFIDALAAQRMPASCELRAYVDEGCLMTYSADLDKMFRAMASVTVRILNGEKPGDIAIEQPREFDFVINMRTARDLGIAIPQIVLLEATDRVE